MSTEHDEDHSRAAGVSRRSVLAVGAVGIPGIALIGCSQAKSPAREPAAGTSAPPAPEACRLRQGPGQAVRHQGRRGDLGQGPDGADIIITRPTETTVAAYSAICTHEGCTVSPAGKELDCPCHGSVFDLKGAVMNGPARRPLDTVKVSLSGDDVVAG